MTRLGPPMQHSPEDIDVTTDTRTLISQLALGATWTHLDDGETSPVAAAAEVIGVDLSAEREAALDDVVATAPDLDWTERVALALHLLLVAEGVGTVRVATAA